MEELESSQRSWLRTWEALQKIRATLSDLAGIAIPVVTAAQLGSPPAAGNVTHVLITLSTLLHAAGDTQLCSWRSHDNRVHQVAIEFFTVTDPEPEYTLGLQRNIFGTAPV